MGSLSLNVNLREGGLIGEPARGAKNEWHVGYYIKCDVFCIYRLMNPGGSSRSVIIIIDQAANMGQALC